MQRARTTSLSSNNTAEDGLLWKIPTALKKSGSTATLNRLLHGTNGLDYSPDDTLEIHADFLEPVLRGVRAIDDEEEDLGDVEETVNELPRTIARTGSCYHQQPIG